jgi:hypothetical protein
MKNHINAYWLKLSLVVGLIAGTLVACNDSEWDQELGPRPTGSFTITPVSGQVNTYELTSDVANAFRYQWNAGEGYKEGGRSETIYLPEAGTYTIGMVAMTRSGHARAEQTLTVATTDPASCSNKIYGCEDTKTWVLNGAGSLWVGPVDGSQTWWALPEGDVAARSCQMNDAFTFHKDGIFVFENQGDLWVEEEGGAPHPADIGLSIGCHSADALPEKYQQWGSGSYTYEINQEAKTITVRGTGAFLGMYKAGDAGTSPGPEASITYNIVELTASRMVVEKVYDWGKWRFTFAPKE